MASLRECGDPRSGYAPRVTTTQRTSSAAIYLALLGCSSSPVTPPRTRPPAAEMQRIDPPARPGAIGANVVGVGGVAFLTWIEPVGGGHQVKMSRLDPSSRAGWSAPVTIVEGADLVANAADFPALARTASGRMVVSFGTRVEGVAEATAIHLAESRDDGQTWTRLGLLHDDGTPTEHGFVSLLAEGEDVRAFWLDGRELVNGDAGATTLRTAVVGTAVRDGALVDPRVCDCCSTSATPSQRGAILAYRDRSDDELRDISLVRREGSGWSAPASVHEDGWRIEGCPVNGPEVATRAGDVAVAWFTNAEERPAVKLALSRDGGVTFAPATVLESASASATPIGRVDVAATQSGAAVTWLAAEGESGIVRLAHIARDGRVGTPLEIGRTTAGRSAGVPRVADLGSSFLVVWMDATASPPRLRATRVAPP